MVVVDIVAVVTFLQQPFDAIAATGWLAGIGAQVFVDSIAIITGFKAFLFGA